MKHSSTRAFSLIELAIVLAVIGLLVGGILMGQELLRAADVKNYFTDIDKIKTSVINFKTKYNYLPGDMPDATNIWGIQAGMTGNDDTCYLSPSTTTATCNGNGDGQVAAGWTGTGWHERARFWQHLSNAGYIQGQYTGVHGTFAATTRIGGVNMMRGVLSGTHYSPSYVAPTAADANFFEHDGQHIIANATDFTSPATAGYLLLTPAENLSIDSKYDDGKPGTGIIRGNKAGSVPSPNCTTTTNPVTSVYATNLQSKECFLYLLMGY